MKYTNAIIAALLMCGVTVTNAETKTIKVKLTNPLNVKRSDVPVVVSLRDVQFNVVDAVVKDGDREVSSQIDDLDRNLRNDELAFVIDMEAKGKKTLTVELYSDKQAERNYPRRTYGDMIVRDFKTSVRLTTYMASTTSNLSCRRASSILTTSSLLPVMAMTCCGQDRR